MQLCAGPAPALVPCPPQVVFYPPGYYNDTGTLVFCSQLPENEVGLRFEFGPIVRMIVMTLMKVNEMMRQNRQGINPRHVVAIYVYTFELKYPDDTGGDQIYGAMNKAMRLRLEKEIQFWRPLIWEIDVALAALPSYTGKLYRGINCRFDTGTYTPGNTICWPSFSSASRSKAVAEEFSKGDEGSLFFLHSESAKKIDAFSRFPDEEEVCC